jgi:osmotically-inducible protein OsmY
MASDGIPSTYEGPGVVRKREPLWPNYAGRGPRGYRPSDERIYEHVCDRLTDDPLVDASDIDVRVSDGEVTLSGNVRSRREKREAEDVAGSVVAVKDVINELRVR